MDITEVSVIVPHLSPSDLNFFVLKNLMKLNAEKISSITVFFENDAPKGFHFPFSTMNIGRLWQNQTNNGTIIATTLESARLIKSLPTGKRKIYYAWDLEFMWGKFNFVDNIEIMSDIEIYTRSESMADAIENYTGKRPKVVPDFNITELLK